MATGTVKQAVKCVDINVRVLTTDGMIAFSVSGAARILSADWVYNDDLFYLARNDHCSPVIGVEDTDGTRSVFLLFPTLVSATRNLVLRVVYI